MLKVFYLFWFILMLLLLFFLINENFIKKNVNWINVIYVYILVWYRCLYEKKL